MRNKFDEQLDTLNLELIRMGAMCEEAIAKVSKALAKRDIAVAKEVKENGFEIDRIERDIEQDCMKLLLHQQPVARDLRQISAALKMITDMERIGDQAEDIAEIVIFLGEQSSQENFSLIDEMAHFATKMVTDSVESFVKKDIETAKAVIEYDDKMDDFFEKIKYNIIDLISKNPNSGEFALDLFMIAKYFERIGDHTTNIAEWVIFSITGEHKGDTL